MIKIDLGKKNIIICVASILLIAVMIAVNIVASFFWNYMMMTFGQSNMDLSTETVKSALKLGDDLVQEIAEDSVVLLKNEHNTLPLAEDARNVNLFGYGSTDKGFIHSGGGSGGTILNRDGRYSEFQVSFADAFEKEGFAYNKELEAIYEKFSSYDANLERGIASICQPPASVYSPDVINAAKDFSKIAVVVISRNGSESVEIPLIQNKVNLPADNSRTNLQLTSEEEEMLGIVTNNFDDVIVILNTSNPVEAGFLELYDVDAALFVGATGQSGTLAIPRILKGYKENDEGKKIPVTPSGKLADTYAYSTREYNPTDANMFANPQYPQHGEISYTESIYFGYRWYETANAEGFFDDVSNEYGDGYAGVVQYPFGHGLSYTEFDWQVDDVSIPEGGTIGAETEIIIKVTVTNRGKVAGKDVVQLYCTPEYHDGEIEKSYVNLLGFVKTALLAPKQSQQVQFKVTAYDLAVYDAYNRNNNGNAGYELDRGDYELKLMTDAHNVSRCEDAVMKYNVPETVNIKKDPVTKEDVVNRFTGEDAYMDLPIDGSNVGGTPVKFLSRADFKGTFPAARTVKRPDKELIAVVNTAKNTRYDTDTMPVMNTDSGLRLVTRADGSKATKSDLAGSSGAELKYNEELLTELGTDFESPKWKTLLDQMSADEMCGMVENGGFQTAPAESIGKPKRRDFDGPAGFHSINASAEDSGKLTAFPAEVLIGCSWNPETAYNMGQAQGVIAGATNINGWYGPGLNLHRNAYSGRYFEYYSEDPVLTGKLGAEIIRGAKNKGLYAYMKHFAVSEEGVNPDNVKTWLTEQTLREIYLKPFEIATKEGGANAVMTAFNCIGAVWAGACDPMNNDILRGEWGFRGSLLSDWSTGRPFMNAEQGIRGGNDLMLDANNNAFSPVSRKDATSVTLARRAAKNILYTWANTYATAKDYQLNGEKDDKYTVDLSFKMTEDPFSPIPVLIVVGANALLAGGIAVCVIFVLKKPRRREEL